jgi:isopenicillin N synthase-like dioxygenase
MKQVPSLDLRRFKTDRTAFVAEVGQAYRELGFCTFSNHGIDPDLISKTYEAFRSFFFLPLPIKMQYWSPERSGKRGYTPFKVETAKDSTHPDLKEFFHIGRDGIGADHPYANFMLPNSWPLEAPGLYQHAWPLYREMEKLGQRILAAMALAIQLPENFFNDVVSQGNSILRGLHYPPVSQQDIPCVRAQAHEDISLITLLLGAQGGGLELLSSQGHWVPVKAVGDEIVVNVGDMMQRLTNHVYVSTTHRVVNPQGDDAKKSRYSIPFFLDPNPDYLINTLPQCISSDNPNRYPQPITANDYLLSRLSEIKVSK